VELIRGGLHAQAAAKNNKTEEDLNEFWQMLTKIAVEAALNAELDDHLGFDKHEQPESDNNRNGVTHKTLQTKDGQFQLATPRDRVGSFEPQLVKKNQRRLKLAVARQYLQTLGLEFANI
jgi:transposase-like protein